MILKDVHDIITWGLTGALTLLFPILQKAIRNSDYRAFIKRGIKMLYMSAFNRVEITHRLFYNVDKYKLITKGLSFRGEKLKTDLFHILLNTKIDTTVEFIKKWMSDKENTKLLNATSGKMLLQSKLMQLIDDIVEAYEQRIKDNYFKLLEDRKLANHLFNISYTGKCLPDCQKYIDNDGNRCDEWCDKTIGFKTYHSKNIEIVNRFLNTIPESEGERNSVLFSFFLNYVDNALHSAVFDAKEVFEKQNGRYKQYD